MSTEAGVRLFLLACSAVFLAASTDWWTGTAAFFLGWGTMPISDRSK